MSSEYGPGRLRLTRGVSLPADQAAESHCFVVEKGTTIFFGTENQPGLPDFLLVEIREEGKPSTTCSLPLSFVLATVAREASAAIETAAQTPQDTTRSVRSQLTVFGDLTAAEQTLRVLLDVDVAEHLIVQQAWALRSLLTRIEKMQKPQL